MCRRRCRTYANKKKTSPTHADHDNNKYHSNWMLIGLTVIFLTSQVAWGCNSAHGTLQNIITTALVPQECQTVLESYQVCYVALDTYHKFANWAAIVPIKWCSWYELSKMVIASLSRGTASPFCPLLRYTWARVYAIFPTRGWLLQSGLALLRHSSRHFAASGSLSWWNREVPYIRIVSKDTRLGCPCASLLSRASASEKYCSALQNFFSLNALNPSWMILKYSDKDTLADKKLWIIRKYSCMAPALSQMHSRSLGTANSGKRSDAIVPWIQ